jgi:hypothetical protein
MDIESPLVDQRSQDTDTSTLASANTPVSSENVKTAVCGVVEELDPCQRGSLNRP